jgi:uncharacterized protein YegP (UPF0339 family)
MASCKEVSGDTWETYQSGREWRWRRTASNGRIVGQSSEGYDNRNDCIANAKRNGMTCNPT